MANLRPKSATATDFVHYIFECHRLIFGPISKIIIYIFAQETESFQISSYLCGMEPKLKLTPGDTHIWIWAWPGPNGHGGPETQPKVWPMGRGFWSSSISKMTFQKK